MLASTKTVSPPASTNLYFEPLSDRSTLDNPSERAFKKHKVLPHPRNGRSEPTAGSRHSHEIFIDTTSTPESRMKVEESPTPPSRSHDESPSVKAPGLGPVLPPTPPAHSRTSSGNHSIRPSSPTYVVTPVQNAANTSVSTTPRTPPHQASPPTPDVTPPQADRESRPSRPVLANRIPSKATDSRTNSFITAPENLDSSEEDNKSTPRAVLSSAKAAQTVARRLIDARQKKGQDIELGLGLESDDNLTPRTKREFSAFDGEWGSASSVEQEWDHKYHDRNIRVEKRRVQAKANGQRPEVVEDVTVTPTNATKALRSMPLSDRLHRHPSPPLEAGSKDKTWAAPSTSESSVSTDVRRSSGMSSKSTVSTVVEAILVGTPPQRQKTLRHVRKQPILRDSSSEISPSSSSANTSLNNASANSSLRQMEISQRARAARKMVDGTVKSESLVSTGTVNSVASRKARREVWKNGGIPVVVIPDRKASIKATGPPSSLRSTSSHRTGRSNSLSSAPLSSFKTKDLTPYFNRPSRRGRAMSESEGSVQVEELTMDYPPIVPIRRSSLSAPTSRNGSRAGSRAGSLTAESLKAHDAFLEQESKQQQQHRQPPQVTVERAPPVEYMSSHSDQRQLEQAPSVESHRDVLHDHKPLVDNNGDPFFGKRLTAHNTPFSQASVETNGTHSAADISEAMAVNIYPHQNKSVLMVHHMSKPVDPVLAANALQGTEPAQTGYATETEVVSDNPKITATGPDGAPATPPQHHFFSMDDVDSPLRNPRAPPEPPAIKFIPATPSGLTPASEKEKMLGNYFEETQKRPSLVRRAFSLRKSTDNVRPSGFLSRTLSLSKGIKREIPENPTLDHNKRNTKRQQYPTVQDTPPDESKLHPFWRPTYDDEFEEYDYDDWTGEVPAEVDTLYRYPPIDNRPTRRRSLSERMKRTFAILPIEDENHYTVPTQRSPERRTVKRTPSGRLRVMKHRDSYGSIKWNGRQDSHEYENEGRPSTAPENQTRRAWGTEKRVDDRGRRLFPNWQDKLEQYKPQNLQRRLSEHRRQKRTEVLRQKISGPREVRDGVGEVIKRNSYKGPSYQTASHLHSAPNGKANGLTHRHHHRHQHQPQVHQRRRSVYI
ncbi:uncharacterized protein F4812DRAFT_451085 [Daldinia caldariorum]|uniref:uncharacterized protein n=1 Tax=Daldinia caldariorum TaxID=326644 RepID=UPI002007FAB6|nr:uncharacterized protein F4812DRAFT_451085 [Daldinia caldariorum]KAI1467817.1 hypothetical protein F4812DRAFT_451085 [Daldinia caldariorum]